MTTKKQKEKQYLKDNEYIEYHHQLRSIRDLVVNLKQSSVPLKNQDIIEEVLDCLRIYDEQEEEVRKEEKEQQRK